MARATPFIILLLQSMSLVLVLVALVDSRNRLNNQAFKARYGALYLDLRTDNQAGYLFTFYFLIRRALYALIIYLLPTSPGLQMLSSILLSIGWLTYVFTQRPYILPIDNAFEIANEFTVLIVFTLSLRYADQAPEPTVGSNFGFAIITVILLNVGANMAFFIWENGRLVVAEARQWLKNRK